MQIARKKKSRNDKKNPTEMSVRARQRKRGREKAIGTDRFLIAFFVFLFIIKI